jgi:hypothetical protein
LTVLFSGSEKNWNITEMGSKETAIAGYLGTEKGAMETPATANAA